MNNTTSACSVCSQPTTKKCSRCSSIHYCALTCATKVHLLHTLVCKPFAEFDMSTRPDTDHYLCVLFPLPSSGSGKEAGPKAQIDPKLVWIKNNGQIKEVVGGLPDVPFRRMRFPLKKDVGSEKEFITTYNHGNFASSIYRLNPNIHKIFPQDYWRGAVLVMFGLGDVKNPSGFRDFKVDDMKHVQHCLTNFDIADELVDSEVCRLIFATALVGGLAATAS